MGKQEKSKTSILTAGMLKENPVLVLLLGTCPTLAVSTTVKSALGMSVATVFVLLCSNIFISLLKDIIPDKVRIPAYIVIIASFVTIVQLIIKAYFPEMNDLLGIYLPLITVNCIILGRAEMFASKNKVLNSILDAIGMGVGFMIALLLMSSIREILGAGTWFGLTVTKNLFDPMILFMLPPGGFLVYGILAAVINHFTKGRIAKRESFGCANCMNSNCAHAMEQEGTL